MPGLDLDDTRATIRSIKAVLNKRKEDMEFKTNIRSTINDQSNKNSILDQENEKLKDKNDSLQNRIKTLTNQGRQNDTNWKGEREGYTTDLEKLRKDNMKMKHQVTQLQHEMKKNEQQREKLKDQIKKKIFDKDMNIKNTIEMTNPIYTSGPLIYVNKSGENEFTYLVTQANQEVQNSLKTENSDLRECIKMLQNELLEIVQVKAKDFSRRYDGAQAQNDHGIEPMDTDLVNMPFEMTGRDIISHFQENIRKLRDFLTRVDKDVDDVFDDDENKEDFKNSNEFANVQSVSQLRHLLKNYKILTEAQESVIDGDIISKSKSIHMFFSYR